MSTWNPTGRGDGTHNPVVPVTPSPLSSHNQNKPNRAAPLASSGEGGDQIRGTWTDPAASLVLCQRDAYTRTVSTKVISCQAVVVEDSSGSSGKKKSKSGGSKKTQYAVVLEETVLYPEGGGQPSDHGTIAGVPVKLVEHNKDGQVVHMVEQGLEVGAEVEVQLDWSRRYDHMQQHTGQHVLSAVAEELNSANTVSWELSARYVSVDLAIGELTVDDIRNIEKRANDCIRNRSKVWLRTVDPRDAAAFESPLLRGKLPTDGSRSVIRLVEIEDLDVNACGGTHVKNTSELQLMTIAKVEKDKGNTRVFFLTGDRALQWMSAALTREAELTSVLAASPAEHVTRVETLCADKKESTKKIKSLNDELATLIGQRLVEGKEPGAAVVYHKSESTVPFLQVMADAALALLPDACLFLSTDDAPPPPQKGKNKAEVPHPGSFLLAGPADVVKALGPQVAQVVGGRGGGRPGRMQGKASNLEKAGELESVLIEAMRETQTKPAN